MLPSEGRKISKESRGGSGMEMGSLTEEVNRESGMKILFGWWEYGIPVGIWEKYESNHAFLPSPDS